MHRWLVVLVLGGLLAGSLSAQEKVVGKSFQVPYRLTNTKHVLVRLKLNGKGPFNFILDTGAPALFVATAVAKEVDVKPDDKGWGSFARVEVEGGVVLDNFKARIEDPFQLKGMNQLNLAGAELHGMIGYQLLARYKLTFDFTKDTMTWQKLDFEPAVPLGLANKEGAKSMNAMSAFVDATLLLLGKPVKPVVAPRGFLGVEMSEADGKTTVTSVYTKSPADLGGVKQGDLVTHVQGNGCASLAEVQKGLNKLAPGDKVTLRIVRGNQKLEIVCTLGEGF